MSSNIVGICQRTIIATCPTDRCDREISMKRLLKGHPSLPLLGGALVLCLAASASGPALFRAAAQEAKSEDGKAYTVKKLVYAPGEVNRYQLKVAMTTDTQMILAEMGFTQTTQEAKPT